MSMKTTMAWVLAVVSVVNGSMLHRFRHELAFRVNNIRNFHLEDWRMRQQCAVDFWTTVKLYGILWEFILSNDVQKAVEEMTSFEINGADILLNDTSANGKVAGRMKTSRAIKRKHVEKLRIIKLFQEVFILNVNYYIEESKKQTPDHSYLSTLRRGAVGYCTLKNDTED